jgi:LacI family transcriptional regulator
MLTMKEIARDTGVSVKTVSRVINREKYVDPKTREQVEKRIEELDYRPNLLARSLVQKKSNTIGLLASRLANPSFGDEIKVIGNALKEKGYSLIISNAETCDDAINAVELLLKQRVDGIIEHTNGFNESGGVGNYEQLIRFNEYSRAVSAKVRKHNIFFSVIEWSIGDDVNSVINDSYQGSVTITGHVLDCGHRRVGYISEISREKYTVIQPWDVWDKRLRGFLDTVKNRGLTQENDLIINESPDFEGGYRGMRRLLEMKSPPSAVITGNDACALGAIYAIREKGLSVPDDFSVAGYDGIEAAGVLWPKLTTMAYDHTKIGSMAVNSLLKTINEPDVITHINVMSALVSGGTVKKISEMK